MVNDLNDHVLSNNTHESEKHPSQHYWGIKSSLQESFEADTEDLIRFGHGFCTSSNKSTGLKRSF